MLLPIFTHNYLSLMLFDVCHPGLTTTSHRTVALPPLLHLASSVTSTQEQSAATHLPVPPSDQELLEQCDPQRHDGSDLISGAWVQGAQALAGAEVPYLDLTTLTPWEEMRTTTA
jgi:hypothetical protein